MIFNSLFAKDFLSIGKVKLALEDRGNVLVVGSNRSGPSVSSNGAGKTSIWDALTWCLYGKTLRGVSTTQVIRNGQKECKVVVRLVDDDGKKWKIIRTRNKNAAKLTVMAAGHDISKSSVAESQEVIDSLLGLDFNTFACSVFFGQDSLRFASLTDKDKKKVLEYLLGLGAYEKAHRLAKQKVAEGRAVYDLTKVSLDKAEDRLSSLRERQKDIRIQVKKEKKEAKHDASKAKKLSEKAGSKIAKLKRQQDFYNKHLENCERVSDRISELQTQIRQCDEKNNRISSEIVQLEKSIKKLVGESLCPTCEQSVKQKGVAKISKKFEEELSIKRDEVKALDRKRNQLETSLTTSKADLELYRKDEKKRELSEIENELRELEKKKAEHDTIASLSKKSESMSALVENKKQVKKELQQISEIKKDLENMGRKIKINRYCDKLFGPAGIRSHLLDGIANFLSDRANSYSGILTDGHIDIEFSTVSHLKSGKVVDKFAIHTTNKNGANAYEGNSAGERQRIDICVALALRDLARSRSKSKIDLAIFDEVFERLDETGCDKVIQLLNQEKENFGSCFIVTHNDSLKPYFSETIKVMKVNGTSRIA